MSNSVLTSLFGDGAQAIIMDYFYVRASDSTAVHAGAVAAATKVPAGSVHKTLAVLVAKQLLVQVQSSRGPAYRAPTGDPRLTHLFALLRQDSDIVRRLRLALKPIKGVSAACIFGSFARGTTHSSSDIDVLVIENDGADRFETLAAIGKVAEKVRRPVNPEFYSTEELRAKLADGDSFVMQVMSENRIGIKGELPVVTAMNHRLAGENAKGSVADRGTAGAS